MVRRITIVAVAILVAGSLLAACSYEKKDDVTTRSTVPTVPVVPTGGRTGVVGTLPPVTTLPTTSPPATTPAATAPPTTAAPATPPPTPATTPRTTRAAPPAASGTATVQAGAYTTREAAVAAVAALGAKGFGGFGVTGSGPFRVQRGPMPRADAEALVQQMAAAGVNAFVRG
jgi:cell division protein FtsN